MPASMAAKLPCRYPSGAHRPQTVEDRDVGAGHAREHGRHAAMQASSGGPSPARRVPMSNGNKDLTDLSRPREDAGKIAAKNTRKPLRGGRLAV